ncbi:hypothetical protein D2919_19710 [Klebsiella pneumoniae]|nr:hypothetical protein [Klebsiella pneumoniae]
MRVGGQAHRADLTTSRIDDDSREPEMRKACKAQPSYVVFLCLLNRLIYGVKKPASRRAQSRRSR